MSCNFQTNRGATFNALRGSSLSVPKAHLSHHCRTPSRSSLIKSGGETGAVVTKAAEGSSFTSVCPTLHSRRVLGAAPDCPSRWAAA